MWGEERVMSGEGRGKKLIHKEGWDRNEGRGE